MGIRVAVASRNICIFKYMEYPDYFEDYYIGHIGELFYDEKKMIQNLKIRQFLFITIMADTFFNTKQIIKLSEELTIIENLNIINTEDFNIIKNGVEMALEKNLYLKFKYD